MGVVHCDTAICIWLWTLIIAYPVKFNVTSKLLVMFPQWICLQSQVKCSKSNTNGSTIKELQPDWVQGSPFNFLTLFPVLYQTTVCLVNPRHMRQRGNYSTVLGLCVCVCYQSTHHQKAFIQLHVDGYINMLYAKIRRFVRFLSKPFLSKVRTLFSLLAFTVHALIAHACVLTRCTQDINPAHPVPAQQC